MDSPCQGALLLVLHTAWERRDGQQVLVTRSTWTCPDGSTKEVEQLDHTGNASP